MDIVTTSSDESDDDARETLAQKEREAEEAAEAARERELEAESILLDKQIEEEIRGRFQPSTQCALTFNPCAVEMTEEEKRLDRIARSSVSKVGYVGYAKMKLGWKMKRDPFKAEDGPNRSQRRLTEAEKKIMEENKRRRELWEKRNGEDGDADQPSEVLSV